MRGGTKWLAVLVLLQGFVALGCGGERKSTGVIAGRVIDAQGRPQPGFDVRVLDLDEDPWMAREPQPAQDQRAGSDRTDHEGRFVLGGLASRSYRLCAVDPDTYLTVLGGPNEPGERDARVQLPAAPYRTIRGTVRSSATGEPITGARVCSALVLRRPAGAPNLTISGANGVRTDERGRFVLRRVPRERATLVVRGPGLRHEGLELARADRDVTIGVECLASFTFAKESDVDSMRAFDARGEELPLAIRLPGGGEERHRLRTPVRMEALYEVGESATELALFRDVGEDAKEALRVPLEVVPGRTCVVELP